MCLEFSSCFGGGRDDYGGERANRNEAGGRRRDRRRNNNRNGYYAGDDHKAPQATYHDQPSSAVEAGQKAYHDGTRKVNHASAGGRGGYAVYAQHKADIETPKLPAWYNEVGHDAYTARRQEAAMDHHHYQSATTTLGRY